MEGTAGAKAGIQATETQLSTPDRENVTKSGIETIRNDNLDKVTALRDGAGRLGQHCELDTDTKHLDNKKQLPGNKGHDMLFEENNSFQKLEENSAPAEDSQGNKNNDEVRLENEKNSKGNSGTYGKSTTNDADDKYDDAVNDKVVPGAPSSTEVQAPVTHTWKVPDGGWGWVVVACALVISLIVDGLTYTFGIFLGDFERAFQEPKSKISLASSIQVGLYLFIGPVVSALTNRFGCRPVIIVGSFIASGAFIASSWSTDVTMLIMLYGVFGGIGFGLMYLPAIVAVSIYFEERRALATGIAVCGSGIGTFILAPLTDYLLYEFNWSWTLLILGALILNGVVFGGLIRPLELQKTVVDESRAVEAESGGRVLQEKAKIAQGYSSTRPQNQEEVPLIAVTDENGIKDVVFVKPDYSQQDTPRTFFSSTPNMGIHSTNQTSKVAFKGDNKASADTSTTNSAKRARSNTLDPLQFGRVKTTFASNKPSASTQPRVRAHAPIGLAFISLSDADLNLIRDDVHLPLSRKDIHLSGPLPFPETDNIHQKDDKGLYVQSVRSLASLSAKDGHERSTGIWSCLPASARETLEQMLSLSILKDKKYWFVLMGNFFCMLGFYVPFVYVPDRAKQLGIEEDKAAFLLSIIGITNTIGRVLTGVVINFLNIDCLLVTALALALAGIMTAMCPFCETYASLAGVSAVFGFCVAAYISLCSVLLCELLGVENLTNAFGFVILFRGVACIMGPPIAGAIFDATGVYDPSFYIGGSMIVLGAVCHALLLIPCCRRERTSTVLGD